MAAGTGAAAKVVATTELFGSRLSPKELKVLELMADGAPDKEICRSLWVSENTVKTHVRRILRKLGARNRTHAVATAFRLGLFETRRYHDEQAAGRGSQPSR
jgi:DNA-binding CsgD family transcriptional regulator